MCWRIELLSPGSVKKNRLFIIINFSRNKYVMKCRKSINWNSHHEKSKTYLYNFDPLKTHFYIVKLGFTGGVHYFSYFRIKHRLRVLIRTASARRFKCVPTIYVLSRNMIKKQTNKKKKKKKKKKKYQNLLSENNWKLSVFVGEIVISYLNRRVFVMISADIQNIPRLYVGIGITFVLF